MGTDWENCSYCCCAELLWGSAFSRKVFEEEIKSREPTFFYIMPILIRNHHVSLNCCHFGVINYKRGETLVTWCQLDRVLGVCVFVYTLTYTQTDIRAHMRQIFSQIQWPFLITESHFSPTLGSFVAQATASVLPGLPHWTGCFIAHEHSSAKKRRKFKSLLRQNQSAG